jgi:HSP20 family protein
MFDDALGLRPMMSATRAISTAAALNIEEFDDRFEISLAIPGLDPNDVKVELIDQTLTVNYEHDEDKQEKKKGKLIRQEYQHYSFSRSVRLPKNINESSIHAKSTKGILTIIIEKLPESKPKQVEIKIEE